MSNWFIINNNTIIDVIIADSQEYVEQAFLLEVLPDDGIKSIGWTRSSGMWQSPYPTDGLEYNWDNTIQSWIPVNPVIIEE